MHRIWPICWRATTPSQESHEDYTSASGGAYIMDAGATVMTFYSGGELEQNTVGSIADGDAVVLNQSCGTEASPTLMNYTVGKDACSNSTKWGQGERGNGCINTALALFCPFPVLYDLDNGEICFPTPGTEAHG